MFSMLQRHAVQVLVAAGVQQARIRETTGVPERTIRRIMKEPPVEGKANRAVLKLLARHFGVPESRRMAAMLLHEMNAWGCR